MAMQEYLKLPISFEPFFQKRKLNTCSLQESIARNLHLLITTSLGENKQNLQYGSQFWDHDYDIHMSSDARREVIINTLKKQIDGYEKRLGNVSLEVAVKQAEYAAAMGKQLRRRIEIIITGVLVHSNEPFRFQTGFFIGPLSFD
jgi:predicted component of type VI protein secretion system